jgi:hypothetical protein
MNIFRFFCSQQSFDIEIESMEHIQLLFLSATKSEERLFKALVKLYIQTKFSKSLKIVMKILVRLHQINAIVRSREEHAARMINACAAAGLRDRHEC